MLAGWFNDYYVETYGGNATIIIYEGDEEHVTIPAEIEGTPLHTIYDFAFTVLNSPNLKTVHVPESVTFGVYAFPDRVKVILY